MSYILITPIINEENNLIRLKNSILNQTIRPIFWVIIDSGSIDNSYQKAKEIFYNFDFIHVIKQKKMYEKGYSIKNFSQAINEAYSYAKKYCLMNKIDYDFIGKTDATPILDVNYYKELIKNMIKNDNLVITCGRQKIFYNNQIINMNSFLNIESTGFNDIRLYRKNFFEKVNGYPIFYSPDSILLVKAKLYGYETKIIDDTHFVKPRLSGSKIGIWNGNILKGKTMYCLCYHPILMMANALYNSLKVPPHYQVIPWIYGYFLALIHREEIYRDKSITTYFYKTRLIKILLKFARITK